MFKCQTGSGSGFAVTEKSYTRMDNYDGVIINGTFYSGMGKFELDRSGKVLKLVDNGTGYVYSADRQPKGYFYDLHEVIKGDQAGKFRMFYEELKENYAFADMYVQILMKNTAGMLRLWTVRQQMKHYMGICAAWLKS